MQTDKWIDNIVSKCPHIWESDTTVNQLVELLIQKCYASVGKLETNIGNLFASAFDLLVSAEYYSSLAHTGWLYCPDPEPRLFFHYTNCCPRHVLDNEFYFNPSNKPTSGKIGTATSKLLLLFYRGIFKHKGLEEEILRGSEPVDAIVLNRKSNKILFAEIKASPLLTLALSTKVEKLTNEVDGEIVDSPHLTMVNANLFSSSIDLVIPEFDGSNWLPRYFSLGIRKDAEDADWGFKGILNLISNDANFFPIYFAYWNASIKAYHPKTNKDIFWLTNGCGTPSPIPANWQKRRVGSGYESISDSKTSVGMDRTDDIKKGIYQVLKIGSEGKPTAHKWDFKVGIISNIDPARHFEHYLQSLKDIVWTNDLSGRAKQIKDLPEDQQLFNLFDGIIALTKTYSRDEWIDKLFQNY